MSLDGIQAYSSTPTTELHPHLPEFIYVVHYFLVPVTPFHLHQQKVWELCSLCAIENIYKTELMD